MPTAFYKRQAPQIIPKRVMKESKTFPLIGEAHRFPYTPDDMYDHIRAYESSVWAYASVFAIANAAAGVELKFYQKDAESKDEEIDNVAMRDVIENPNPFMTEFDLWEATYSYLELSGNCYWEVVREKRTNKISEIYVLRPDLIKIQGDAKTLVNKYIYTVNGIEIPFEPSEIIHFQYFNPLSELYGFSSMKPASQTLSIDLYALLYNKNFFKLGARVGGVLETDKHLSSEAITRLEDTWQAEYAGYQSAWRTAVLQEGLKYREIAPTHTEMDFINLRKQTREEVFAVMGIYPIVVGLMESASYANAHQQKKLFYQNTIIPKLKKVQSRITKEVKKEDNKVKAMYDTNSIEALREEKEIEAQIDSQYVDSGIMTINEIRSQHRLPPVSWGDKWWPRKGTRTPVGIKGSFKETLPGAESTPIRIFNRKGGV